MVSKSVTDLAKGDFVVSDKILELIHDPPMPVMTLTFSESF